MSKLLHADLQWCLKGLPEPVLRLLSDYPETVFVGGGYVRSMIAGEKVNDIDLFVKSKELGRVYADILADQATFGKGSVYETDNAFTIRGIKPTVQIIHRWTYQQPEDLINSFDFTIAMGAFWYQEVFGWTSMCHERFYADLAAKRLYYTQPQRNEDAGGSMLRVLKFYQRGYRIPIDSLGAVIARCVKDVDLSEIEGRHELNHEQQWAKVITGLLREVDPNIDPTHLAHLPAEEVPNA